MLSVIGGGNTVGLRIALREPQAHCGSAARFNVLSVPFCVSGSDPGTSFPKTVLDDVRIGVPTDDGDSMGGVCATLNPYRLRITVTNTPNRA